MWLMCENAMRSYFPYLFVTGGVPEGTDPVPSGKLRNGLDDVQQGTQAEPQRSRLPRRCSESSARHGYTQHW